MFVMGGILLVAIGAIATTGSAWGGESGNCLSGGKVGAEWSSGSSSSSSNDDNGSCLITILVA